MKKVAVLGIIILSVTVGLVIGSRSVRLGQAEADTTPVQVCQYPDRLSNPPGGCDNSDPACGEIAKGATSCPSDTLTPQPTTNVEPTQSAPKCAN